MKTLLYVMLILWLAGQPVAAQHATLTVGSVDTLASSALGEARPFYVHLPENYDRVNARYPVLVVLDADWNFRKVVGIVDHLSESGRIPAHIVIGIPNIIRTGRHTRLSDLAPTSPNTPGADGAHRFLQFIADELVPHVSQTYRSEPHYTLMGHSLGGLFAVYAMLERPESFAAYIAISPSLGRNNQQQVARADNFFDAQPTLKKNLQLVVGNEGGNTQAGIEAMSALLKRKAPAQLSWQLHEFPREDHVSVFHPGTYTALETIFDGWKIPDSYLTDLDISIAERHYQGLSDRLGFTVQVPAAYYRELGYKILAAHEYDYAQWTFEQYAKAYPEAAGPFVGMGDVSLMQGAFEAARSSYEAALERNPSEARARHMFDALSSR